MRHRMGVAAMTHLGNPAPERLDNKYKLTSVMKNMMGDAVELYFKKWGGCDYKITDVGSIEIGIEPAYMYEDVKIIHICKHNKNFSHILTGIAWGAYGSDWATTRKYYGDYKYKSKFVKFIDRWHDKIF